MPEENELINPNPDVTEDDSKFFDIYRSLIDQPASAPDLKESPPYSVTPAKVENIADDVASETQRIKNTGLRQDIELRKATLWILFTFLALETVVVFSFTFFRRSNAGVSRWRNGVLNF